MSSTGQQIDKQTTTKPKESIINITPEASSLWKGLGGHFDDFSQILCEFIDNSIASFPPGWRNRNIYITLKPELQTSVHVEIVDNGPGIVDLESAFTIGKKDEKASLLNEHGFGLKHALATANPANDSWSVKTRLVGEDTFHRMISAPFDFTMSVDHHLIDNLVLPASGTAVSFTCTRYLFDSLKARKDNNLDATVKLLIEDLGYIYAGVLDKGQCSILVNNLDNEFGFVSVPAVKPKWADMYNPGQNVIPYDLGDGKINIEYAFGKMRPAEYKRHYGTNMRDAGIEIRINGRIIEKGLIAKIWELTTHPNQNSFLGVINLITKDKKALPKTRTSKNGFRTGDLKLKRLFNWIRTTFPKIPKNTVGNLSEKQLVKELATLKETHLRAADKHVETEFSVFSEILSNPLADLYVYDGAEVIIYEAKKYSASVQDFYQLIMYWDGLVSDGIKPNEGVLLAPQHVKGLSLILGNYNSRLDANGNNYNFVLKTWEDEGIELLD